MMRPATAEEFARAFLTPSEPRQPDPVPSFDLWSLRKETLDLLRADLWGGNWFNYG